MSEATRTRLEQILRERFQPVHLELADESALHAGHSGAAGGGGHFRLVLVSAAFAGLPRLERHRLVYQALENLMSREVHALSIRALGPDEWKG